MLHITNGDSVVAGLRASGLRGEFLAWRDPLHDGPVPTTASLPELSMIRAEALAGFGSGELAEIHADFRERDARLSAFRDHEEVVLWFEHDLYDRLQLTQILAWFDQEPPGNLSLIEVDQHPEVTPFYGLGQLSGPQLAALFPGRVPVEAERLEEAAHGWRIFTSTSHEELTGLDRLLEEYPGVTDGLSRTERQLLLAAREGADSRRDLYLAASRYEECPWGDSSVFLRLDDLSSGPDPALRQDARGNYSLTDTGVGILAGEVDWLVARGGADRWLGGVHLTGFAPKWRWDSKAFRLQSQTQ